VIDATPVPETLAAKAGTLFDQFREGDKAKMADLVALLTPILWHTARAQRLDAHSAEDVVQSAWLALIRNAGSITSPIAVLHWMIVTVRREAWRTASRQSRLGAMEADEFEERPSNEESPDELVLRSADASALWRHVAQLPARCQQLLRVIAFADRPDYSAVADALGMPVGSIGPTRGRCLAKLRALLSTDPAWGIE
jgi:RNA polymerase sigma factor (sigma-70 family)